MFMKPQLGLAEARAAVDAAIAEASKDPGKPMCVAVVDEHGSLIACARMDGSLAIFMKMAINKAYTAARMFRDTATFAEQQRAKNRELDVWGDGQYTLIPGGLCIIKPGKGYIPDNKLTGDVVGGIGASGRPSVEDARIARVGLKAIKF